MKTNQLLSHCNNIFIKKTMSAKSRWRLKSTLKKQDYTQSNWKLKIVYNNYDAQIRKIIRNIKYAWWYTRNDTKDNLQVPNI